MFCSAAPQAKCSKTSGVFRREQRWGALTRAIDATEDLPRGLRESGAVWGPHRLPVRGAATPGKGCPGPTVRSPRPTVVLSASFQKDTHHEYSTNRSFPNLPDLCLLSSFAQIFPGNVTKDVDQHSWDSSCCFQGSLGGPASAWATGPGTQLSRGGPQGTRLAMHSVAGTVVGSALSQGNASQSLKHLPIRR